MEGICEAWYHEQCRVGYHHRIMTSYDVKMLKIPRPRIEPCVTMQVCFCPTQKEEKEEKSDSSVDILRCLKIFGYYVKISTYIYQSFNFLSIIKFGLISV